eukprot:3506542-Amphidinium_carterae.1
MFKAILLSALTLEVQELVGARQLAEAMCLRQPISYYRTRRQTISSKSIGMHLVEDRDNVLLCRGAQQCCMSVISKPTNPHQSHKAGEVQNG